MKGGVPAKGRARVLSEPGSQYAAYLYGGPEATLSLALPAGRYVAEWVSPLTGEVLKRESVAAAGATTELASPRFDPDIALRVVARP